MCLIPHFAIGVQESDFFPHLIGVLESKIY